MDGEEVDPMMMDLVEGERRLGNEQMEHSVDPPFSARAPDRGPRCEISEPSAAFWASKLASFRFHLAHAP